jgi:murein L,D-transpeptidase YcbB/YkuD
MVAAGATVTVPLAAPIPVYLAYFTAEPDGQGGIRFFPDIYRRDHTPSQSADSGCKG